MVLAKKQLSKVVAIVLVAMCAVAFMPMLNGEAFAAAKVKKPAKVTIQSVKQVSKTTKVKVTWKKATNAKTYNIKIDKKVVKKNYKKQTFTSAALKAGKHKVYVQAVNGKVKGAWSKAKAVTVKPLPAKVEINGLPIVGKTLKAVVYDKDGKEITSGVTYQWYRTGANTGGDNPIAGATNAEYTVVAADAGGENGYPLYVTATAVGKTVKAAETAQVKAVTEITYFVALDKEAVEKGHTVPVVGDTVKVGVKYDGKVDPYYPYAYKGEEFTSIQWYADDVAINGADDDSFTLTPHELGKVITAKMVLTHEDGTREEFATDPSEKVIASTLPTAAKITGMTVETEYNADGTVKAPGTPAVGDTLTVEFTAPAGAVDEKATYQWKRNGYAISGATSATYTVKQADLGQELTCEVINSDKGEVTFVSNAITEVCGNMSSAVVALTTKTPTMEAGDGIASVKLGETPITAGYTVAWYVDSVADANKIYTADGTAVTAIAANQQYYLVKDATAKTPEYVKTTLVGHKLIATAEGKGTEYVGEGTKYVGVAKSEATSAVTATIATVRIDSDTGAKTTAATTLTASVATDPANTDISGEPDVKYQWSKKATADGEFVNIAGATKATYAPTEADQVANVIAYKVTITGTDVYKVASANAAEYTCDWDDPASAKVVTITIENTTEAARATTPAVGDVLKAKASVASAEGTMTYTWKLMNGSTQVEEKTGASYTIPTTAKKNYTVTVAATNSDASYAISEFTYAGTVQGLITRVELVSNKTVLSNFLPTGDPKDDHVANPQVGDVLAANVTAEVAANSTTGITKGKTGYSFETSGDSYNVASTAVEKYQWYADGKAISGENASTYVIQAADLGKKISVKVIGGTGYAGAEMTSAESGAVVAYGKLVVDADPNMPLVTGTPYDVYVVDAYDSEINLIDATYTVKDNQTGEIIPVEDGQFVLTTYNVGHTVTITVSADGLAGITADALTWTTDFEIVEGSDVPLP